MGWDVMKKLIYSVIVILLICIISSLGYWNYLKENSNRVIHAFDDTYVTKKFDAPDFKYSDLSSEIRNVVSKEEFDSWKTWEDVKKSFSKVEPERTNMSFLFHGQILRADYEFTLTGYKLCYVEFKRP
jgi:hypothetical protein